MSLGPLLLGAAVTLILTSVCSAGICDTVPPGRYCLSSLEGFDECAYNRNTLKMEDRIFSCSTGTRCSCMGIQCQTSFPCQPYILPPIMPDSYRAEYNEERTVCSPMGCNPTYSTFAFSRDAVNQRYKELHTFSNGNPPQQYFIVLPNYRLRRYVKYHIVPRRRNCTKSFIPNFPPKIEVPQKVSYSGRRYVSGEYTKKWVWKSGGRPGHGINVETWDTAQTRNGIPTVVQYTADFPGSEMSKTSVKISRYYYMFKPGVPSIFEFQLPTYCRR